MVATYYRVYELPWTMSSEDELRFRKILLSVFAVLLLFSVAMPWLPVPELPETRFEEIEPRFARLMLEKQKPPPPPPVPVQEQPEPETVAEQPQVEPEAELERTVEPDPVPEPEVQVVDTARERASRAGLLPFAEELAALRDNEAVAAVTSNGDLNSGVGEGVRSERALITSKVGQASGGINTAALSRNTGGGGGLGDHATAKVESPVGQGTGKQARRIGQSAKASRSREEIEMVFDQNKGAIYALYNRALRKNPGLQGKLVLKLTIEPSGAVTACEVVSSELGDDELERKLVQRIKMFRFQAKDVEVVTTTKPIDFFPA